MTWIKICGMTTPDAVASAVEVGADAIGFVFARSSRMLTPSAAVRLAAPARGRILCIAVTRHPSQAAIDEIVAEFRPDVLQTDQNDLQQLRLPQTLALLPVMRQPPPADMGLPPRLLFEGPASGSGRRCDWRAAGRIASRAEVVLAGGLNAANVVAALTEVRPFGVDVSSGVESRPALKSPIKIARFVAAVRSLTPALPSEELA